MSQSEDATKIKGLSLLDFKLPAPEVKIEPMEGENSLTYEEVAYYKIIAINPLIEELISDLDLVSSKTGERIKKVKIIYQLKIVERVSSNQLFVLAHGIIREKDSYTKEEVITRLTDEVKVSRERAKRVFYMMLEAEIIEATHGGKYYLTNSLLK